jgi:transposase
MEYIAFDSHKRYTWASVEKLSGGQLCEQRVEHERGSIKQFLSRWAAGSPVAVETVGNWYWIVDEIEEAGMVPWLVHARKAKLMLAMMNKTDKLDARGLNRLQRTGTLPTVWIPPRELRDQRELPRTRMVFSRMRTRLKNRIHATLAKYALGVEEVSDLFGRKGRVLLQRVVEKLPPQTRFATERLLEQLDVVEQHIKHFEGRIREVFEPAAELALVMSLPGVGFILGIVILLEIGDVNRFASAEHLASYAGTTPRVKASGGKVHYGQVRQDVNRYLKWAFMEAANVICLNHRRFPQRHVHRLYERVAPRKGYQKAIGAVARHLAEATYWILKKGEPYREPRTQKKVSSTKG